jgi:hypothetical protein
MATLMPLMAVPDFLAMTPVVWPGSWAEVRMVLIVLLLAAVWPLEVVPAHMPQHCGHC